MGEPIGEFGWFWGKANSFLLVCGVLPAVPVDMGEEVGPFFDLSPPLLPLDRPDALRNVATRDGDKFVGEELIFRGFEAIIGFTQLALLYFPEIRNKIKGFT